MFPRKLRSENITTNQWLKEDEINCKKGQFINLRRNPEAYTGYQGQHIWNAVYDENCYNSKFQDFDCIEEISFYKIISGLHSNINAHLSYNYYAFTNGYLEKQINVSMYNERIAKYPERINNLFYIYSLLLKSFVNAESLIKDFKKETGNSLEDKETDKLIEDLFLKFENVNKTFLKFENSSNLKKFLRFNKIDQTILRFRNISEIFNCVACEKCKLHGKLQIFGLSAMMKILFNSNLESSNLNLSRNELIAFINLFMKVTNAIDYISKMNNIIIKESLGYKSITMISFAVYIVLFLIINHYIYRANITKLKKLKNKYKKD